MLRKITLTATLIAGLFLFAVQMGRAVSPTIGYQGRLLDAGGAPVSDGNYTIIFHIYDDSTAGTQLWSETHEVSTADGLFSVQLGETVPLDLSLFGDSSTFLEIQLSGESPMAPRTRLSSSPSAAVARRLDGDVSTGRGSVKVDEGDPTDGIVLVDTAGSPVLSIYEDDATGGENPLYQARMSAGGLVFTDSSGDTTAMYHLHGEGIVHRDVAARNVMKVDMYDGGGKYVGEAGFVADTGGGKYSFMNELGDTTATYGGNGMRLAEGNITRTYFCPDSLVMKSKGGDVGPIAWMAPESIRMSSGNGGPIAWMAPESLVMEGGGGGGGGAVYLTADALSMATGVDTTVRINGDGSMRCVGAVSIGVVDNSAMLTVGGDICATGTIGACSDARFKKDVRTETGALDKVLHLRGVTFDWKRAEFPEHMFSKSRQVGFIAQEVKEVVPEIVTQGTDGYYSVDYGRLTPVLVEAMKEQQRTIAELQEKVERLEQKANETESLKAQVAQLEAVVNVLVAQKNSSGGQSQLAENK